MSLMGTPENNCEYLEIDTSQNCVSSSAEQSFRAAASELSISPNRQPDAVKFPQATSTLPTEPYGYLTHEAPIPDMPADFVWGDPLLTSPESDPVAQTSATATWTDVYAQMFGYPQCATASPEEFATIPEGVYNSTDGSPSSQHCTYASSEGNEGTGDLFASPTPSLTSSPPSPFDHCGMCIGDQFRYAYDLSIVIV